MTQTLAHRTVASRSTIALKLLMALSGLVFVAFVAAHMYGNLKAFSGRVAFDEYAYHLRTLGEPILPHAGALTVLRTVLIALLVVHVWCAVVLWRRARRARPQRYAVKKSSGASFGSRTMRWGGLALLLFIVWHLLNFSIGKVNVSGGGTADPYYLVVDTFSVWWMTLIYLAAMAALGLHLWHGVWSAAQTLGWTGDGRARHTARAVAAVLAVVIAGGFSVVPIFVLLGVIS